MHHRGAHVGDVFIGDRNGGEAFTREDEEVLLLFASQAGAAIANARSHRDEQRARAGLEALIEASPVGVVAFDARTGSPVSVNQESRRIVEGLCRPDQPVEDLLKTITYRRSDGRQGSLAELLLQSSGGETVQAEELTLSVPGGRRVEVLVNATPIRSAAGAVDSVVVTLQDLAPLEELDRLRGEFLSVVSHELRAPLTSIKGSAATVLGASQPPDLSEVVQFFRIIDQQADHMRSLINDLMDAERIETGTLSIAPEPVAVAALVDQARNTFLSGGGRHAVRIELPPDLPRVLVDRQRIVQVLNNLFSNAARHSPASSPIRIAALRRWRARCGLGDRWRSGRTAGTTAPPVPEARRRRPRRPQGRCATVRPRPVHLQGAGGGAWGPHLGRERPGEPGHAVHVHHPGRPRCGHPRPERLPSPHQGLIPVSIVINDHPHKAHYVRDAPARVDVTTRDGRTLLSAYCEPRG